MIETADFREAYGRVLAEDVLAKADVPGRNSSHFDGFAVRALDIARARADAEVTLVVKEGVPLGVAPKIEIRSGEASKVATGGFLPHGADTVIVPGVDDIHAPVPSAVVRAIRRAHERGARVASICTGAFVLAATGL